jgi:hypothetical protein
MKTPRPWTPLADLELRRGLRTILAAFLLVSIQWAGGKAKAEETASRSAEGGFQQSIPPYPIQMVIPVQFGSNETLAIIDTGTTNTMIDLSLKSLTSEKLGGSKLIDAAGDSKPIEVFRGPDLAIQNLHRATPPVLLMDLRNAERRLGLPVKAVLGVSDLQTGKLFIDRNANFVVFHHGKWRLNAPPAAEVPLLKERRTPCIEAVFGGQRCQLLVDTGYDQCITLEAPLFEAMVASGNIRRSTKVGINETAFSGPRETKGTDGVFLKGELMGKSLVGVDVDSQKGTSKIGMAWLHGFSIEIDFADRKLRYQQLPEAAAPTNIHGMLGAAVFFVEGEPVVVALKPGGGAAREAGIEKGDRIERLGDIAGKALNAVTLYEAIQKHAGKDLTVIARRGPGGETKEVTVKLPKLMSLWHEENEE